VGGASVCSYQCDPANLDADCPSGYACTGSVPSAVCVPKASCSTVLQAFGQICTDDVQCSAALADAKCQGLVKAKNDVVLQAGYCTSRCTSQTDCPTGFTCDSSLLVCTH
jgi:hypothetical protein